MPSTRIVDNLKISLEAFKTYDEGYGTILTFLDNVNANDDNLLDLLYVFFSHEKVNDKHINTILKELSNHNKYLVSPLGVLLTRAFNAVMPNGVNRIESGDPSQIFISLKTQEDLNQASFLLSTILKDKVEINPTDLTIKIPVTIKNVQEINTKFISRMRDRQKDWVEINKPSWLERIIKFVKNNLPKKVDESFKTESAGSANVASSTQANDTPAVTSTSSGSTQPPKPSRKNLFSSWGKSKEANNKNETSKNEPPDKPRNSSRYRT